MDNMEDLFEELGVTFLDIEPKTEHEIVRDEDLDIDRIILD